MEVPLRRRGVDLLAALPIPADAPCLTEVSLSTRKPIMTAIDCCCPEARAAVRDHGRTAVGA
jgi:hypothetical protein